MIGVCVKFIVAMRRGKSGGKSGPKVVILACTCELCGCLNSSLFPTQKDAEKVSQLREFKAKTCPNAARINFTG